MGILDRFEKRVDRTVNGAFARAFKAEVQPVEMAAALQRELDDRAAIVSRGRTVVPNAFTITLSSEDYDRLSVYAETLQAELAGLVKEYAEQQRYTFLGPVSTTMNLDETLDTGLFRVVSEAKAAVTGRAATPAAGPTAARLVTAGGEFTLKPGVNRLGRGEDADIRIDDPGVSRHHAEITVGKDAALRDLGSTNGSFVDGVQVTESLLRDGATIRLGSTSLTYRSGS
ncbi:MAG: FHA domain-containing protein [Candidatus Nanopelagicales bacterium]|nr:FHA domain-containing protein [Candidatus Nanopelagicales bacterium]